MATHSMYLPGESQGRGSLVGCRLSWTRVKRLSSSSSSNMILSRLSDYFEFNTDTDSEISRLDLIVPHVRHIPSKCSDKMYCLLVI